MEKVFADAGYQRPRVAHATSIAIQIVRKLPGQVGFVVQRNSAAPVAPVAPVPCAWKTSAKSSPIVATCDEQPAALLIVPSLTVVFQ